MSDEAGEVVKRLAKAIDDRCDQLSLDNIDRNVYRISFLKSVLLTVLTMQPDTIRTVNTMTDTLLEISENAEGI